MASKKFSQMASKKLSALLETASDEDKVEIQKVLDARTLAQQAPTNNVEEADESELSQEEEAAIAAAEANGGINPLYTSKSDNAIKITDEERKALAEEIKEKVVGHRCAIVPHNALEWVNGTVTGIIEDKRSNKVLVAVKTDDGRRMVKTFGSKLLNILDETVEVVRAPRARKKQVKAEAVDNSIDWTQDEINEAINEIVQNVGRSISYPKFSIAERQKEGDEAIIEEGRIVSLIPDKRGKRILYRVELTQTAEEIKAEVSKKYTHKVSSNEKLTLAEELDEVGKAINESYIARRERAIERVLLTPFQKVKVAEKALDTVKLQLKKLIETADKRNAAYEKAKKEYEASLSAEEKELDKETNQDELA